MLGARLALLHGGTEDFDEGGAEVDGLLAEGVDGGGLVVDAAQGAEQGKQHRGLTGDAGIVRGVEVLQQAGSGWFGARAEQFRRGALQTPDVAGKPSGGLRFGKGADAAKGLHHGLLQFDAAVELFLLLLQGGAGCAACRGELPGDGGLLCLERLELSLGLLLNGGEVLGF